MVEKTKKRERENRIFIPRPWRAGTIVSWQFVRNSEVTYACLPLALLVTDSPRVATSLRTHQETTPLAQHA